MLWPLKLLSVQFQGSLKPFGAMMSNSTSLAALVLSPVVWNVSSRVPTDLPLNFVPTVSVVSSRPFWVLGPAGWSGIARGVLMLNVTTLELFFFFMASATLPDTRPTVTLSTSARTPISARRERLLLIRQLPP